MAVQILRRREQQPLLAAAFGQLPRHFQRQRRGLQILHVGRVKQIHVILGALADEAGLAIDLARVELLACRGVENVTGQNLVSRHLVALSSDSNCIALPTSMNENEPPRPFCNASSFAFGTPLMTRRIRSAVMWSAYSFSSIRTKRRPPF